MFVPGRGSLEAAFVWGLPVDANDVTPRVEAGDTTQTTAAVPATIDEGH